MKADANRCEKRNVLSEREPGVDIMGGVPPPSPPPSPPP